MSSARVGAQMSGPLESNVTEAVPCIMVTGYASTDSAIEALQLGATDYLN